MTRHTCGYARYGSDPQTSEWRCISDYKLWPSLGCGAIWTTEEGLEGKTSSTSLDASKNNTLREDGVLKRTTPSYRDGGVVRFSGRPEPDTNRTTNRTTSRSKTPEPDTNRTTNRTTTVSVVRPRTGQRTGQE